MNPRIASALLAAIFLAPAAPSLAGDEWVTIRNEMGTVEIQVPPGFQEVKSEKPSLHINLLYSGAPYKSSIIRVYAHQGYTKPEHLKDFMGFVEKDIGCPPEYEEGSKTRFTAEKAGSEGTPWIMLVEGRVEGGYGIYFLAQVPKDVYDETKDDWAKVRDSFKTAGPAAETFETPKDWKVVRNDMYVVMGPVKEVKDPKARQKFEDRLYRVMTWLDPQTSEWVKMFRSLTSDVRKYPEKQVVHVLATPEAFRAAAGGAMVDGATVLYLPDHKDRVLLVDGSPDAVLEERMFVPEAGLQYMESRTGKMWPWMREALRMYFTAGFERRFVLGAFPPEMLKRGKEVFAARPATLEDLMKKDEAGMRELGEPGRIAAWGIFQAGLHGDDAPVRLLFRKFLRDAVGAKDLGPVWEKATAAWAEDTKKKYKPREIDSAAKKYFKELKEEKEKR